jgi:hypothetical protein
MLRVREDTAQTSNSLARHGGRSLDVESGRKADTPLFSREFKRMKPDMQHGGAPLQAVDVLPR